MKLPPVGWAFFGLAVVILIGYLLTIGVFVGSVITADPRADGEFLYSRDCHYLHLSGIRTVWNHGAVGTSRPQVEASSNGFCPPFGSSK